MRIAIMQPYLFPYIGYFQLINYVDKWVVFDDTQYISKGWINRNRILHPELNKEWQYFTVPVKKHSRVSRINNIEINDDIKWRDKLLGKLTSYKNKAPRYAETLELIEHCISYKCSNISELAVYTLENTCSYIGVPFDYSIYSKMGIRADNITHAGQWALELADAIGADEYVNPYGGYDIFNENEFLDRRIDLRFLKPNLTVYDQRREGFVPGLSIIDVMMWNNTERIRRMINDFEIVTHSSLKMLNDV